MDHEVMDDENDWMEEFNNTQILSDDEEAGACFDSKARWNHAEASDESGHFRQRCRFER